MAKFSYLKKIMWLLIFCIIITQLQASFPKDVAKKLSDKKIKQRMKSRMKKIMKQKRLRKYSRFLLNTLLVKKPKEILNKVRNREGSVSIFIYNHLQTNTRYNLIDYNDTGPPSKKLLSNFVSDLNNIIIEKNIYENIDKDDITLTDEINILIQSNMEGRNLFLLNRLILESAYPGAIVKYRRQTRSGGLITKGKIGVVRKFSAKEKKARFLALHQGKVFHEPLGAKKKETKKDKKNSKPPVKKEEEESSSSWVLPILAIVVVAFLIKQYNSTAAA